MNRVRVRRRHVFTQSGGFNVRTITLCSALLLGGSVACDRDHAPSPDSAAAAAAHPAAMPAMAGDSGKSGGMGMADMAHPDAVVERTKADLSALQQAAGADVVKLVPAHAVVVEALIADCEQMMETMKMPAPEKWTNAVAELRTDLGRMRSANTAAVHAMLPAHAERVNAMLSMRHDMMKM